MSEGEQMLQWQVVYFIHLFIRLPVNSVCETSPGNNQWYVVGIDAPDNLEMVSTVQIKENTKLLSENGI